MLEFLKHATDPKSIIQLGGVWLLCIVIFAETGLLIGFFLPGDNLILLAGILCKAKPELMQLNYFTLVFFMIIDLEALVPVVIFIILIWKPLSQCFL